MANEKPAPVRVTGALHRKMTQARLRMSAEIGHDITMGDIAEAAFILAESHPEEFRAALAALTETES
jgi:hypothetical protein